MVNKEKDLFLDEFFNAANVFSQNGKKKITRLKKEEWGDGYEQEIETIQSESEQAGEIEFNAGQVGKTQLQIEYPKAEGKALKRKVTIFICYAVLVPLTIWISFAFMGNRKYMVISYMMFFYAVIPFLISFERKKNGARKIVLIATLSALTVLSRAAFFMIPSFKPIAAMIIISAAVYGEETGVLVAFTSILVSNFMFGQGPWTPWQMLAYGCIGYFAGVLFAEGRLKRGKLNLCIYGFLSVIFLFGGIMNPAILLMYSGDISWQKVLAMYISGFPFDLIQALSTVAFLFIAARAMMEKMERVKTKYGI